MRRPDPKRLIVPAAAAAALFAFWPALDRPFIADEIDLAYGASLSDGLRSRGALFMDFATRPDWFRPLVGAVETVLFGLWPVDPAPHRLVILALLGAASGFVYLVGRRLFGERAGLISSVLFLLGWVNWATLAPVINVGSAGAQCAFLAALWLALEDAREGGTLFSVSRWPLAAFAGLMLKEDLLVFPALAAAVQLALRPTRRQLAASLGAGLALQGAYWLTRWLIVGDLSVGAVPGTVLEPRVANEIVDYRDYARVLETFLAPVVALGRAPGIWDALLRAQGPAAAAAWLGAAAGLGLVLGRALAAPAAAGPGEPVLERRTAWLVLCAFFVVGVWPYVFFKEGLWDVQRAARSCAALALAAGPAAAALAARRPRLFAASACLLFVHSAAAFRQPDPEIPVFNSAVLHAETAQALSAVDAVLGADWKPGDFALFRGFGHARAGFLSSIWGRRKFGRFDWDIWEDGRPAPPASTRWPKDGSRLWLVQRFWLSRLSSRLVITRYPDERAWEFVWETGPGSDPPRLPF